MTLRLPVPAALRKPLKVGLAAAAFTLAASLMSPDYYQSGVMILPRGAGGISLASLVATTGLLGGGGALSGIDEEAHYADIVQSRWMAEKLLKSTYQFSYRPWAFARVQERRETLEQFLDARAPRRHEGALRKVSKWVHTDRNPKTGVLSIDSLAPSPELAQQLADKATHLLDEALRTRVMDSGSARALFARQRLEEARLEEDKARAAMEAYARNHVNFAQSLDPGIRFKGERLADQLALRRQMVVTLTMGQEQAELDARSTVAVLSWLDDAYLPLEKARPRRGLLMAFLAFLAGSAGTLAWRERVALARRLRGPEGSPQPVADRLLDS
jgi:hypothetical protein